MKTYDIFLFDADNTLYDFDKCSTHALETIFAEHNLPYTADIPKLFYDIGTPLWERFERGQISGRELQKVRFANLFAELDIYLDPVEFNGKYLYALGRSPFLVDGALEICRELTEQGKKIYIVTNGFQISQQTRMEFSGLRQYISGCFISEIIGHEKPGTGFFDYVFSNIPDVQKERVLIVGDSLTADIAGGNNYGIDNCWFNFRKEENRTDIVPTYEIKHLNEISSLRRGGL